MALPSPKQSKLRGETSYVRSPVVILPPAKPGGPSRRIALKPTRVFLLLGVVFLLGCVATTLVLGWMVQRVRVSNQDLASEMDLLRQEVASLKAAPPPAPVAPVEEAVEPAETASAEPATKPSLNIPIASLRGPEPKVRIAVVFGADSATLVGEGLHFIHKTGRRTPLPGKVQLRVANGGVFAKGVGTLKNGTAIETSLGPIRIGNEEYPGRMEIFREDKKMLLVNEVEMEAYVASVVASELPASWGLEAKKAQAVAARTYAFMRRGKTGRSYDLDGTVADQVYRGSNSDASSRAAVTATRGQVLGLDDRLVSSFYSSTCAGQTEAPEHVWPGRPSHGIVSVTCGYCANSRSMEWSAEITAADLLSAARQSGHRAKEVNDLLVVETHSSGRTGSLELKTDKGGILWASNEFRQLIGWDRVRSTLFDIESSSAGFTLSGRGFGHGVGLCQWGTQGMDRKGMDYKEILSHYYRSSKLEVLY